MSSNTTWSSNQISTTPYTITTTGNPTWTNNTTTMSGTTFSSKITSPKTIQMEAPEIQINGFNLLDLIFELAEIVNNPDKLIVWLTDPNEMKRNYAQKIFERIENGNNK